MIKRILIAIVCFYGFGCEQKQTVRSGVAMVRVSSDGRYALTSHYGRALLLWDLQTRKSRLLHTNVSLFSPYFLPESHDFLWQDARTNRVYVESVAGVIKRTYEPGFEVFGHVMSSKKSYVASRDDWSLHQFHSNQWRCIKNKSHVYKGSARLLHLTVQQQVLLTSGEGQLACETHPFILARNLANTSHNGALCQTNTVLDGVTLWNLNSGKPVRKFIGNVAKTMATLSPDGHYVVGADENGLLYRWNTNNGKRAVFDDPRRVPKDFYAHPWANDPRSVAVTFIDEEGHFIRWIHSVNYATLYHVNSAKVLAYLPLGELPRPDLFSVFTSANLIASAPKANVFVMGQSNVGMSANQGSGIIVYRFDNSTQTLLRVWAPEGPGPHKRIVNPNNPWES